MSVKSESNGTTEKKHVTSLSLLKAYYFFGFCFNATFMRYLTLYFEADGLVATEIGLIWSVTRIINTISTPFWAMLADYTRRARSMMLASLVLSLFAFLLLAHPIADARKKFWPRALTMWVFQACFSPTAGLFDSLAISACSKDSDRWGRARVYGAVGWGLMHLVLGPLLDRFGFVAMFVSFVVFHAAFSSIVKSSMPEACGEKEGTVTAHAVAKIFKRNQIFFINLIAIGGGFAMVEGMLFLLLQEMNGSTLLCGTSVMVTVLFELPIFHYAQWLLDKLGPHKMILVGQGAWVVRALFYVYMPEAWMVLLIEPLHGVTFALVWTAATQYVADPAVCGDGLEASGQGLLQLCFMGLGPVLGLSLGGYLFDVVGSHKVYGCFASVVLLFGLLYATVGNTCKSTAGKYETCDSTPTAPTPVGRSSSQNADGETRVLHDAPNIVV